MSNSYQPLFTDWPASREELWERVRRFVEAWSARPLTNACGVSESEVAAAELRLGLPLPLALREWQQLAGHRIELWNELEDLAPDDPSFTWLPATYFWSGEAKRKRLNFWRVCGGPFDAHLHVLAANVGMDDPPVTMANVHLGRLVEGLTPRASAQFGRDRQTREGLALR